MRWKALVCSSVVIQSSRCAAVVPSQLVHFVGAGLVPGEHHVEQVAVDGDVIVRGSARARVVAARQGPARCGLRAFGGAAAQRGRALRRYRRPRWFAADQVISALVGVAFLEQQLPVLPARAAKSFCASACRFSAFSPSRGENCLSRPRSSGFSSIQRSATCAFVSVQSVAVPRDGSTGLRTEPGPEALTVTRLTRKFCQPASGWKRSPCMAFELGQTSHDRIEAARACILQRPAAKGAKPVPKITPASSRSASSTTRSRRHGDRFVDHRQHQAICEVGRRGAAGRAASAACRRATRRSLAASSCRNFSLDQRLPARAALRRPNAWTRILPTRRHTSRPTTSASSIGPIGMPKSSAARVDASPAARLLRASEHRFAQVRHQHAVDEESGRTATRRAASLSICAREGETGLHASGRVRSDVNDFDQRHARDRIEEVQADEAPGRARFAASCSSTMLDVFVASTAPRFHAAARGARTARAWRSGSRRWLR